MSWVAMQLQMSKSLAELRLAEPSRIRAAPAEVAVTAGAMRPTKSSEPVLDAVQEQQQARSATAGAFLQQHRSQKPVPLPVPPAARQTQGQSCA